MIFGLCGFVYVCVHVCLLGLRDFPLLTLTVCVFVCGIPKTIYNGQYWVSEREEAGKGSE